jgi:hypothetical protein
MRPKFMVGNWKMHTTAAVASRNNLFVALITLGEFTGTIIR